MKKVLVIDDESSIVTYLTTVLEDFGYEHVSATDPEEGAALARSEQPDLICMDVMMPKRSGIALYQEFKQDPALKDTPVIFISAFNQIRDLRDRTAFRKMIPDESIGQPELCLEKPIRVQEFVAAVGSLVGGGDVDTGEERGSS